MQKLISPSLFLLTVSLLFSCKKEVSYEEQLTQDIKKIQAYLAENNLTAQSTASGLHYLIEVEGNGEHPTINDVVVVHYKGYYLDGTVFDQTGTDPISFPLSAVITGWQEGIPLFSKGGKGKLFLPSGLAYGKNPPSGVPANAVMIFDVELIDF